MRMKTTITLELESNIGEQLATICARYNLSLEEAFTLFAATVVQAGRFPYDMEVPNAVTQATMAAAVKGVTLRDIGPNGAVAWNKRGSDVEISPLQAATLALHGAFTTRRKPGRKQRLRRLA